MPEPRAMLSRRGRGVVEAGEEAVKKGERPVWQGRKEEMEIPRFSNQRHHTNQQDYQNENNASSTP